MAGVRLFRNTDPNIMRFPQWTDNVYYPAGSFVAVPTVNPANNAEVTFKFYANTADVAADNKTNQVGALIVDGGSWSPADSDSDWQNHSIYGTNPWILAFDTTENSIIAELIPQLNAVNALFPLVGIDSDVVVLYNQDSDLSIRILDNDSDILKIIHDYRAADSDNDSDILARQDSDRHDFKAADSDIRVMITRMVKDVDSDILMEIHDRKGADSDLQVQIWNNDSDIIQRWHDVLGIDSDRDSDFRSIHARLNKDSDRLTTFDKKYKDRDSDVDVKFANIDSDIDYIYKNGVGGASASGFHAGVILPFAHNDLPDGFRIADGTTFNELAYPDLFRRLGSNRLPDLRNQFILGWNNDSDGANSADYIKGQKSFGVASGTAKTIRTTRLVLAIAMYDGAGIVTDSELISSLMAIELADRDSDIRALYALTDFYVDVWAPTVDVGANTARNIGTDSSKFTDRTVLLNGVEVSQWTLTTNTLTLGFPLRANTDIITVKLRR